MQNARLMFPCINRCVINLSLTGFDLDEIAELKTFYLKIIALTARDSNGRVRYQTVFFLLF